MGNTERKRRETEVLRERVLDAAEEIFVKEGVEQVTMRRIAASIEYAPTVLYRLFANKNDLIDHLIARGYEGVRRRYADVLGQKGLGPLDTLDRILEGYVDYALGHPNHYRMWFDTGRLILDGDLLRLIHGRLDFVVFQTWLDSIEACIEAGFFPRRTTLDVFQVLWARVHGLIALRLQHPDFPWLPVGRHLAEVLDLHREGSVDPSAGPATTGP